MYLQNELYQYDTFICAHAFMISDINECASTPCDNGGTCTDSVDGYACTCIAGYTGVHCETCMLTSLKLKMITE